MQKTLISTFENGTFFKKADLLSIEEPLEIRLCGDGFDESLAITMRTPGNDEELAAGFLFGEGLLRNINQVKTLKSCRDKNAVRLQLNNPHQLDLSKIRRHFYTTSSCGVCGKASIKALKSQSLYKPNSCHTASNVLNSLPELLYSAQNEFDNTGGLHASGIFDLKGRLEILREDVGRHNALDKVVGHYFLKNRLPLGEKILCLSGRASFELIQKASMAGIPIVAAIGAPSSLAVSLAEETGITLVGFLKAERFNVYSHSWRIQTEHAIKNHEDLQPL